MPVYPGAFSDALQESLHRPTTTQTRHPPAAACHVRAFRKAARQAPGPCCPASPTELVSEAFARGDAAATLDAVTSDVDWAQEAASNAAPAATARWPTCRRCQPIGGPELASPKGRPPSISAGSHPSRTRAAARIHSGREVRPPRRSTQVDGAADAAGCGASWEAAAAKDSRRVDTAERWVARSPSWDRSAPITGPTVGGGRGRTARTSCGPKPSPRSSTSKDAAADRHSPPIARPSAP